MGELTYPQIFILALIQGAAELLPVSSSAHVILAEKLMHLDPSRPELTFLLVMLHTGTMFAVLYYYWPRWKAMLVPAPADKGVAPARWHFVGMVVLATVVTGVFGYGLLFFIERVVLVGLLKREKGEVEELFKNLPLIGVALLAAGAVILAAGRGGRDKVPTGRLTAATAAWVGWIQGLCLPFRGFSRSGATISMGLFRGLPRPLAEEFSFALAVVLTPPVIVRYLLRLLKAREWQTSEHLLQLLLPGLVGMALSCLAGLAALRLLSAMLERGQWKYFGYYCIGAALVVFAAALAGY